MDVLAMGIKLKVDFVRFVPLLAMNDAVDRHRTPPRIESNSACRASRGERWSEEQKLAGLAW
jgi:hypothetical protein